MIMVAHVCFYVVAVDILDDMLAGVGWSMDEYCKSGEEDYYSPLPNGNRLFVYDIRTIAVRAGVAMGEEGDAVVSHIFSQVTFSAPVRTYTDTPKMYS